MFDGGALRGFVNSLTVNVARLTGEQAKATLVRTAEAARNRVLSEQTARGGVAPTYRVIVDSAEGAPLTAVRADGTIVFAWQYLPEIARDALGMLRQRSPRTSGEFIAGLLMLVDGQEADLDAITINTREVAIVASVQYARRLEVGKRRDGSPFVIQVEPHFVRETAIVVGNLFGDLAKVEFGFVDLSGAYRPRHPTGRRKHAEGAIRYPAILIKPRVA